MSISRTADRNEAQAKSHFYYTRAKESWKFYTMRLSPDDFQQLKLLARKKRRSMNEIIRIYITWGLEQEED